MKEIVLASQNPKKVKELQGILDGHGIAVRALSDFPEVGEIEETGTTFVENALLKAETVAAITGLPVLADDSGLMVDALNGDPGVYSARYAGDDADDEKNNALLLQRLTTAGVNDRHAHFVCVIALAVPGMASQTFSGRCDGEILTVKQGEGGFGYDPLFYVSSLGKSFAEATPEEKQSLSHRGKALKQFVAYLQNQQNAAHGGLKNQEHSQCGRN